VLLALLQVWPDKTLLHLHSALALNILYGQHRTGCALNWVDNVREELPAGEAVPAATAATCGGSGVRGGSFGKFGSSSSQPLLLFAPLGGVGQVDS